MNPEINVLLIRAGIKKSQLARELKCSPAGIYQILSGRQNSKRILKHTAKRLQITTEELKQFIAGQKAAA